MDFKSKFLKGSALIVIFLAVAVFAQDQGEAVQDVAGGAIDWTDQVVMATGIGTPNPKLSPAQQRTSALTAARIDAYRRLMEIVKGVNLTAETVVNNSMVESDVIRVTVEGTLRGFRTVGAPRYMDDGTVELDVEVSLSGKILGALLPPTGSKQDEKETEEIPSDPSGSYTGMVVDCRGLNVQFALSPRLLDENGEEVYGPDWVDRDIAEDKGIVQYGTDESAFASRVGDNPFKVDGLRAAGSNNCDVVISDADAVVLTSTRDNLLFMDECKVAFLVD
ncbi:MAG: hypothetical protein GF315_03785 [candidate division Zixibacteria bacterium]|nr:hypothetical protein [candidate division Zixibacteria bacterium]